MSESSAVSEYNEKTVRKSPKTRNYSTQSMENLPVIIAEVSVAPSGELFRNTFFFSPHVSDFYRRFYQNTTNHVMGTRADHDKSRYEAYSDIIVIPKSVFMGITLYLLQLMNTCPYYTCIVNRKKKARTLLY